MKKIIVTVMCLAACLALTACGSKNVISGYTSGSVRLGQYRGVTYEGTKVEVTDDEVAEDVQTNLLEKYKQNVPVEGRTIVEDGDVVIVNYKGFIDGEQFDGGTAENAEIIIGQSSMIPGFVEGMIGCEIGVTKNVDCTFPEDYFNADVAGKDAVFEITVNQICVKQEPEYTDETVATYTEYSTVAEYNDYVRETILSRKQSSENTKKQYQVFKKIIENTEFASEALAPEIETNRANLVQQHDYNYNNYFGIDSLTYYQTYIGMDEDETNEYFDTMARMQTKYVFVLSAIAEEEGLTASAEEIATLAENMTASYGYETQAELYNKLEEYYGVSGNEVVATQVKMNKAMDIVLDSAVNINE